MNNAGDNPSQEKPPYRVRLPGFLVEEEAGLGDLVQRGLHTLGFRACDACRQRAAALNRWMVFTRMEDRHG